MQNLNRLAVVSGRQFLVTPQLHRASHSSEGLSPGARQALTCSFSANSLHLFFFTNSCCDVCEEQDFIPLCAKFKNSLVYAAMDPKNKHNAVSLNHIIGLVWFPQFLYSDRGSVLQPCLLS